MTSARTEDIAPHAVRPESWTARLNRRAGRDTGSLATIMAHANRRDVITLSGGFPAAETFPVEVIRSLTDELLGGAGTAQALQYSPTAGLPAARDAVADMVGRRQGRRPDQVLITSGSIDALQLVGKSVLDRGDQVLVGAPTYLGALAVFDDFDSQVLGVALDEDGLDVDAVGELLAGGARPKLIYVIPEHQNPAGVSLDGSRRLALIELCRRYGTLLVEDVAYRDLTFDGSAPPSLWSMAPDVVVQIGTFSKIFAPGMRIGWAIGPAPILAAMTAAKQTTDQCSGALGQMLMAGYVGRGHLERNLVRARQLYQARAGAMSAALAAHMPDDVRWTHPSGGFFVWLTAPDRVDTTALAPRAAESGVTYVPGRPFFADGRGGNCMRLSYSRAVEDDIERAVAILAGLLRAEADS